MVRRLLLLLLMAACSIEARKRFRLRRGKHMHHKRKHHSKPKVAAVDGTDKASAETAAGAKKQRFFAYDLDPPNYGERFSTRKRYSVHAFHFVQMLEKLDPLHEWTLVLAPFTTTFDGMRTFTPWKNLFDIAELTNVFPRIIDYEDFMKQHENRVDHFVALRPGDKECKTYPSYELSATGTPMKAMGQQVTVDNLSCPEWNYDPDLLAKKVHELLKPAQDSVFVGDFFVQTKSNFVGDSTDDWSLRKHWAFAPLLHQEVGACLLYLRVLRRVWCVCISLAVVCFFHFFFLSLPLSG
jgi:hypothetical protein